MSFDVSQFVSTVAVHFPPRFEIKAKDPDGSKAERAAKEQEWLRGIAAILNRYSPAVLEKAAHEIIDTRTDRRFPLVAECKKVCDKHATTEYRERNERPLTDQHKVSADPFGDWREKLADDLIMAGSMGRTAALEGWIGCLHYFCQHNGRLPKDHEVSKIKEDAKGFDKAYEDCVRGKGGILNAALLKLGDSMLARREKYRAMVLGDGA